MLIFDRSTTALRTWPDSYLEHWGEYYIAHPEIIARGVRFETFLFAPVEILRALRPREIPVEVRSGAFLVAAQRARLALERAGACCSNGALVEKLRHTRSKRTRHRLRNQDGRLL